MNVIAFVRYTAPSVTQVQFVHDEQPGMEGRLQDAFSAARRAVQHDCSFRMSHLQFEDSKEVLPLQAADILAYETRKDVANRLEVPQRCRSRALIHLLEHRPHIGVYADTDVMDDVNRGRGLPPVLYRSPGIETWMPWVDGAYADLAPTALMPDDQENA